MIGLSVVHWHMARERLDLRRRTGRHPDPVHHARFLQRSIRPRSPTIAGASPCRCCGIWRAAKIVNNESSEIIRMFNSAFDGIGAAPGDFYPAGARGEIDALNDRIYPNVNNGVYRAGFARSQAAYEEAARALFSTLDWLEERLAMHRWLCGEETHRGGLAAVHHADPLRSGLCRPFQVQYPPHRRLSEPVALSARRSTPCRASPTPSISITSSITITSSHPQLNPSGIVPIGPELEILDDPGTVVA